MSAQMVQAWLAGAGTLLVALVGLFRYFNYKSKRDRKAAVGASFAATVDALASDSETRRMAAAVLLRRFFDPSTEQGEAGTPYLRETIQVIAGMLREPQPGNLQKVLADGLRYARDIAGSDLQRCNLAHAYLGRKKGDRWRLDMSEADLFEADCSGASFREVVAADAVFYRTTLVGTVFTGADLRRADFRAADLSEAAFAGAQIEGARFADAKNLPAELTALLTANHVGRPGAVVRAADAS
jgi:Pentapeptide repeats (9 copies)